MLVMRPAQMADLTEVQRLAADSPVGVTSLPDDADRLREKIAASEASFSAEVSFNGEESYFFVLEDSESGVDAEPEAGSDSQREADANAEARKKDWFNTAQFAQARFVSSSIKPLGGNRYQVSGKLTLKGITRELSAPFTATPQGKAVSIDGTLPISRLAFKIGEGSWSDTGTVADNVDLRFRLVVANP